jgi:glycosyltransferase involved in cell wall biosynthesis
LKNLAIVIPVFNEEKTIEKVVLSWSKVLAQNEFDIILINDGSTDSTQKILLDLDDKIKNLVLINKENEGHGFTIVKGYQYAVDKNYSYIFQTDSDDQFSPKDFEKFWNRREKLNEVDIIMGSRKNRNDPIIRIFLSKIVLRIILKLFFGKNLVDPNIPYRLMSGNFISKFLKIKPEKYIVPNIVMSLFANDVIFVDVLHYKRIYGEVSWSMTKLFNFGLRLLKDLNNFRKIGNIRK